jgi:C4-dicarboxylate-specific signal transduction histidine kinase
VIPPAPAADHALEERLREMNQALMVSLVRQQELAAQALAAERKLNDDERVRQRQLALTNALRVSTVGELATGLAHELSQPLSSISNLVEACSQYARAGTVDRTKLLELLSGIAGETMRAASIVAHLRSLVSKGVSVLRRVDLAEVVSGVPRLLMRDLELAHTRLVIDLSAEPLPVRADRIQLEQVLVNLIHNAIDSITETGGDHRLIELSARANNGMAEVSVRDTGVGLDAEAAERMFEPFYTTKTLGLGIGLALSRSILEAHHGRIWMEQPSDGGPGLVVRFAIQLQKSRRGE